MLLGGEHVAVVDRLEIRPRLAAQIADGLVDAHRGTQTRLARADETAGGGGGRELTDPERTLAAWQPGQQRRLVARLEAEEQILGLVRRQPPEALGALGGVEERPGVGEFVARQRLGECVCVGCHPCPRSSGFPRPPAL